MRIWCGPAGLDEHFEQGGGRAPLQHPGPAQGGLAAVAGGEQGAQPGVGDRADGGADDQAVLQGPAAGQGPVALDHPVLAPGGLEQGAGRVGAREQDDARGLPAQPVHGAGLGIPGPHLGQQGVLQEPAAGQGRQAPGLGHGHQQVVLEQQPGTGCRPRAPPRGGGATPVPARAPGGCRGPPAGRPAPARPARSGRATGLRWNAGAGADQVPEQGAPLPGSARR